jgi:hypothetical protein
LEKMAAPGQVRSRNGVVEQVRKFDSRSADAVRQVDRVVNKPGIPIAAPLTPRLKGRATQLRH